MAEPFHGLPSRLVFYFPEMRHKTAALAALETGKEHTLPVEICHADSEARMLEAATSGSMVISYSSAKGRLGNLLYQAGVPFHLTLSDFRVMWPQAYLTKQSLQPGLFILAYLPPHIERITAAMAALYGYDVIRVHHYSELKKAIRSSTQPMHLVFDQDMPSLKNKQQGDNRETIFRTIKVARKENMRFSVSVIKDFDQGSLFEDLGSSVRDITPALFSPEEFLTFFRSILFDFHYEKINRTYSDSSAKLIPFSPFTRNRSPLFGHLNDLKRCFHYSESEQRQSITRTRHNFFAELQNLYQKDSMLTWMDDVFSRTNSDSQIERGALMFFERHDGVTVSMKTLPPVRCDLENHKDQMRE